MARSWTGGDAASLITTRSVSWANSASQNTEVTVDLGSPDSLARSASPGLLVVVRNPSTVTELACEVRFQVDDNGTTRYPKLTSFSAIRANADGEAFLVDGGLLVRGQISLKNSTALGGSDGFSARVIVYGF